ncbi:surfeit locus protein 6-domain-containing protein [Coniochaeta sp. 2T2.1]|nr:surfeit locus protein 6-domain-containing protein [Coniochaeta sp. 2T2.1]
MAEASLQDRLREHSKAFDGLLSLIPAKMYYGEDTSDQWKKKKQTKAEAKAAKRSKLDPDSELNKNAKEVMDERARNKRKLRDMQEPESSEDEQDDVSLDLDVEKEKPGEGLKKAAPAPEAETEEPDSKKPKLDEDAQPEAELSERAKAKLDKKLAKQKKKEEKESKKKAKKSAEEPAEDGADAQPAEEDQPAPEKKDKQKSKKTKDAVIHESTESDPTRDEDGEMEQISVPGLVDEEDQNRDAPSTSSSTPHSPVFDTAAAISAPSSVEAASTTTSLASAVAPSEKPKHIKIPTDTTALRARLAARIEALRAARKADGSDGKPILTRSELIEERRRKQAQRKAHKKELRLKAKQEEDLKREEALASARNSPGGGLMSPVIPLNDDVETSFAFGRVAFGDGTTLSRDLTYEKEAGPTKKKLDPKSALAKVEAQKRRLAELDDDKRKDVLEKETWLAARRKAEGEKVRDDEGLLKKAVKRKEKAKQKSEKEWKERKAGVAKGIHDRQKKREANLQARRDGKGQKGKKKSGPTKKKAARPGFEGSFSVGGKKK